MCCFPESIVVPEVQKVKERSRAAPKSSLLARAGVLVLVGYERGSAKQVTSAAKYGRIHATTANEPGLLAHLFIYRIKTLPKGAIKR